MNMINTIATPDYYAIHRRRSSDNLNQNICQHCGSNDLRQQRDRRIFEGDYRYICRDCGESSFFDYDTDMMDCMSNADRLINLISKKWGITKKALSRFNEAELIELENSEMLCKAIANLNNNTRSKSIQYHDNDLMNEILTLLWDDPSIKLSDVCRKYLIPQNTVSARFKRRFKITIRDHKSSY